jgi:hypothetical protein
MKLSAWLRARITAVMAVAFTSEHAEAMLLSAMYLAISQSLDVTASQLGTLSMWRALVQVRNGCRSYALYSFEQAGTISSDFQGCVRVARSRACVRLVQNRILFHFSAAQGANVDLFHASSPS